MKKSLNFLLFLTLVVCSLILAFSIYPGVLQSSPVMMAIAVFGLLLIFVIFVTLITFIILVVPEKLHASQARVIRLRPQLSQAAQIRIGLILATLICSFGLLKFYVPRRIAFNFSRPAFEQWLTAHPSSEASRISPKPDQQFPTLKLGLYTVDQYGRDPQGGTYFRVYSHGAGLSPDTISYGFVYQPNSNQSPFGSGSYRVYPLGDGWYWFQSSNDW